MLRRIIRRAIRYGRRLDLDEPFLAQVAETVLPLFRQVYRELLENHDFILRVIRLEEDRFGQTYERGNGIINEMIEFRDSLRKTERKEGAVYFPGIIRESDEDENTGAKLANTFLVAPSQSLEEAIRLSGVITGGETFVLYDTYGFPPELTAEIARENGLDVDMEGFEREMEVQASAVKNRPRLHRRHGDGDCLRETWVSARRRSRAIKEFTKRRP